MRVRPPFDRALTEYFLARYTQMRNYSLSSRLLRSYRSRPYSWFLNRHSADLGKTILSEVQQVIAQALIPAAKVVAQGVIVACIIAMLLIVDPLVFVGSRFAGRLLPGDLSFPAPLPGPHRSESGQGESGTVSNCPGGL